LKVYSIYNPEVGYCQGMSFICAFLLINNLTEEEAFWMLLGIMENFQQNFSQTMVGILDSNETFNQLLKLYNPIIHNHLEKIQSINAIFINRWFLTLYTDLKNWQTIQHIWDIIFFEGKTSLMRISLAIIRCCEKHILECKQFSKLGPFLINIPKEIIQPKYLFPVLFSVDIDELLKKLNSNPPEIATKNSSLTAPDSSLLSHISNFWTQFNQTYLYEPEPRNLFSTVSIGIKKFL